MKFMSIQFTNSLPTERYGVYDKYHHTLELLYAADDISHISFWLADAVQRGEDTEFYRVVDHKLLENDNDAQAKRTV